MSVSEAAERLRVNAYRDDDYWDGIFTSFQKAEDQESLANAYLPELDPTPVDEEWARSVAVEISRSCGINTAILDTKGLAWFFLMPGIPFVVKAKGMSVRLNNPTRGQVRTIYRGLFGVALKEDGR